MVLGSSAGQAQSPEDTGVGGQAAQAVAINKQHGLAGRYEQVMKAEGLFEVSN